MSEDILLKLVLGALAKDFVEQTNENGYFSQEEMIVLEVVPSVLGSKQKSSDITTNARKCEPTSLFAKSKSVRTSIHGFLRK